MNNKRKNLDKSPKKCNINEDKNISISPTKLFEKLTLNNLDIEHEKIIPNKKIK